MNDFRESPTAFRGPFDRAYTRLSVSTRQTPLAELPAPVQDEIPISQLPLAGLITGDEMTAIVQNGVTSRATINAVVLASGLNPGLINKTITLVYSAQVGQADFSLSLPDHFGNTYPLTVSNALHVTVDGVRFIEDDGSGSFGNYTINIGSNTVTLLVPLNGGNDVVFDIFNINVQDVTLDSAINTQPLAVTAPNTLSSLAFVPNGSMTIIYVNGRAFSDDSIPPSFTVTGQLITWVDPLISIAPGDEVIAAYTYNGPGGGGGGGGGGGSGIPEPPADGTLYGRENGNWLHISHTDIQDWAPATAAFAPLNSPAFTGTPSLPSGATGVTATPGDNSTALATTAFVGAAFAPPASTTPPLMDGAAAPGMSLAWARGDHVHPSDTSRAPAVTGGYLALSGGGMTGPLTVLAPTAALQAANMQYVDSARYGENRIINGDMRIDQRNNGASGTATGFTIDRWAYGATQASKGTWSRNGPSVTSGAFGFPYYLNFTSSSAFTPAAADFFAFSQNIEADMVGDFAWGTASAQPVTLSFYASCTLAGTFGGTIRNYAGTRSYPFTFSLPAPGLTKIAVTIPGDTAGAWVMGGNAGSVIVTFDLGSGATMRAPAGAWTNGNFIGANGAVSVVGTNGATFAVTGVKLEIGSVATPFNRQSLAKSMADCQRYYQSFARVLIGGYNIASGLIFGSFMYPVAMRAAPTLTFGAVSYGNASAMAINTNPDGLAVSLMATVTTTGIASATAIPLTASAEL